MNTPSKLDIKALCAILEEIGRMSEHASLTGIQNGIAPRLAARYNEVLSGLVEHQHPATSHFKPLSPSEATLGDLAVDSQLLSSAIQAGNKRRDHDSGYHSVIALAPFLEPNDLAEMLRNEMKSSEALPKDLLPGLAPFLSREFLGELVRMHLDEARKAAAPTDPEPAPSHLVEPASSVSVASQNQGYPTELETPQRPQILNRPEY